MPDHRLEVDVDSQGSLEYKSAEHIIFFIGTKADYATSPSEPAPTFVQATRGKNAAPFEFTYYELDMTGKDEYAGRWKAAGQSEWGDGLVRRPLQEVLGPGTLLASRLLRRDLCTISLGFWSRRGLVLSGIVSRMHGAFLLLRTDNISTQSKNDELQN